LERHIQLSQKARLVNFPIGESITKITNNTITKAKTNRKWRGAGHALLRLQFAKKIATSCCNNGGERGKWKKKETTLFYFKIIIYDLKLQ